MELVLWRHAEAEDGLDDLARELTPKGRKQAAKMADWLNERLPVDCRILASPATRAKQTVRALGKPFEIVPAISPGANWKEVLDAAGWPGRDEDCVLLAGHQPSLGEVAAHLLGAEDSLAIRKAAVWWFSSRKRANSSEVILRAVMGPDFL
ncbi:MAG: histidine phosphatase family protein [Hydrogenophilaceae bacterium]|nr:histidine phosphatase family protein [Hydrogenophilaceae bacterium]